MLELRGEEDLATKPLHVHSRAQLRRQHLHDHFAPEAHVFCKEDARHAAATELAVDVVGVADCRSQTVEQRRPERSGEVGKMSGLAFTTRPSL